MGSWNHTCMISRMPVHSGEEVVSIFLAQRPPEMVDSHRCYVHALYDPLPFLIYGEYNDYGALENFTGPQDDVVVDWFKNNVLEMDQGDNPVHDIPVKRDELTMDLIYEIDHEGRLFVEFDTYLHKGLRRAVDHIVIKKSLFDRILDETILDSYQSTGYHHYKFQDLLWNIDGAVQWLKDYWRPYDPNDESLSPKLRVALMMASVRELDQLVHGTWHNTDIPPQCAWLRKREWHGLPDPFVTAFKNADFEQAKVLLIERLKFSWLEAWLAYARHWWQVPGNTGGQEDQFEYHEMLGRFMLDEIKRRKHEYDEEEWSEPDEDAA
jgi:hypothetical protein